MTPKRKPTLRRTRPDSRTVRVLFTEDELEGLKKIVQKLKTEPAYYGVRGIDTGTAIRFAVGRCLAGMGESP